MGSKGAGTYAGGGVEIKILGSPRVVAGISWETGVVKIAVDFIAGGQLLGSPPVVGGHQKLKDLGGVG